MIRALFIIVVISLACYACGSSEPEAEATWETHTVAPDSSSGSEAEPEPD